MNSINLKKHLIIIKAFVGLLLTTNETCNSKITKKSTTLRLPKGKDLVPADDLGTAKIEKTLKQATADVSATQTRVDVTVKAHKTAKEEVQQQKVGLEAAKEEVQQQKVGLEAAKEEVQRKAAKAEAERQRKKAEAEAERQRKKAEAEAERQRKKAEAEAERQRKKEEVQLDETKLPNLDQLALKLGDYIKDNKVFLKNINDLLRTSVNYLKGGTVLKSIDWKLNKQVRGMIGKQQNWSEKEKSAIFLGYYIKKYIELKYLDAGKELEPEEKSNRQKVYTDFIERYNDLSKKYRKGQPLLDKKEYFIGTCELFTRYRCIDIAKKSSEDDMKGCTCVDLNPNFLEHHVEWNAANCHALTAAAFVHQIGENIPVDFVYVTKRLPVDCNWETSPEFTKKYLLSKEIRNIGKGLELLDYIKECVTKKAKTVMAIANNDGTHIYAAVLGYGAFFIFDVYPIKYTGSTQMSNLFVWQKTDWESFSQKNNPAYIYYYTIPQA